MYHCYNRFENHYNDSLISPVAMLLLWVISVIITTFYFHWQQPFHLVLWLVGLWGGWLSLWFYRVKSKRAKTTKIQWYALVLLLGCLVALSHSVVQNATQLSPLVHGQDLTVHGYVISTPQQRGLFTKFDFQLTHPDEMMHRARLSWHHAPPLAMQQRCDLVLRLRTPHGVASAGAMDNEARLARQGIQATGYVKYGSCDALTASSTSTQWLAQLRDWIRSDVLAEPILLNSGLMAALVLGDKTAIEPQQWQLFSHTGTTHLMVISGLHIGLMAWLGFQFAWLLSYAGALPLLRVPRHYFSIVLGLSFALVYALLAGFSVPVQRALMMTAIALCLPMFGVRVSPLVLWLSAMAIILALAPLAITDRGFWYSFVAVGALLFGCAGRVNSDKTVWQRWLKPQWLVFALLSPLLLYHGQGISIWSPLINLVAIPLIGVLVVPALFLAILLYLPLPAVARAVLHGTDFVLDCYQQGLQWLMAHTSLFSLTGQVSWVVLGLAMLGATLLLSPTALKLRSIGLMMGLPLFYSKWQSPDYGEAEVTVLDVGQALSIIVRTQQHTLIFDTGDYYSEHFTATEQSILPALRTQGVNEIDMVIVSHDDRDHAGGLPSLLQHFPATLVMAGAPLAHYEGMPLLCRAGQHWHWDGVDFIVLAGGQYQGNDASCVLKITTSGHSALLTGDISQRVEKALLKNNADLRSDVLIAPHHGSRFSSHDAFIAAVSPTFALFSAGYYNRFHHPAAETVQRYQTANVAVLNTAVNGSLSFTLEREALPIQIQSYRQQYPHYWRH